MSEKSSQQCAYDEITHFSMTNQKDGKYDDTERVAWKKHEINNKRKRNKVVNLKRKKRDETFKLHPVLMLFHFILLGDAIPRCLFSIDIDCKINRPRILENVLLLSIDYSFNLLYLISGSSQVLFLYLFFLGINEKNFHNFFVFFSRLSVSHANRSHEYEICCYQCFSCSCRLLIYHFCW